MPLHSKFAPARPTGRMGSLLIVAVLSGTPIGVAAEPSNPKSEAVNASPLPGGSQALTETFDDWQVVCTTPQGGKRCVVIQQQANPNTHQRVLSIELQPQGGGVEGVLVLPFGLDLEKSVTLKVGDADVAPEPLRVHTCLPQGCVAPLNLDAKAVAALRKAPTAAVGASGDGNQNLSFPVSLKGFGPALDRAAALVK